MSEFLTLMIPVFAALLYPLIYAGYSRILHYKRDEIISLMSRGETFQTYLQAFHAVDPKIETEVNKEDQLTRIVEQLFNTYYDWRAYLIPIFLCTVLSFIACTSGLARAGIAVTGMPESVADLARRLPPVSLAALAGAYVWGLYEMIRNFKGLNLTPTRINLIWLRLLMAPMLGYLLSFPLNDSGKLLAGFAVGAFPLTQLLEIVQARGKKLMNLESSKTASEGPTLQHIQGLTEELIDILADEGICSTEHLAQADPIKLLLRTRVEWKIILDLIDQAYLFNYIGDKLSRLAPMGIRGAIEMATLHEGFEKEASEEERAAAEDLLGIVAKALKEEPQSVRNLVKALNEDVQVQFIWNLWGEV